MDFLEKRVESLGQDKGTKVKWKKHLGKKLPCTLSGEPIFT